MRTVLVHNDIEAAIARHYAETMKDTQVMMVNDLVVADHCYDENIDLINTGLEITEENLKLRKQFGEIGRTVRIVRVEMPHQFRLF